MKIFKSKIDLWLFLPFLLPVFFLIASIMAGHYFSATIALIGLLFFADLFKKTDYTVDENNLKIRAGIIVKKNIGIDSIRKIEKTSSILSSPALSLDRLLIRYNAFDEIMVSPKEKLEFVKKLLEINPNIEIKL